jgi:hypothetical protein
MVELVEAAASIDSVKGNTEKYEPAAEPEAESPRTGCDPGRVAQPQMPAKRAAQQKVVEVVRSENPALEAKMMA